MPLMGDKLRSLPKSLIFAFIYFFICAFFNHHNVISFMVIVHSFYLVIGIAFLWRLYETLDLKTIHFIYYGMIAGSLIQCAFIYARFNGFDLYPMLMSWFGAKTLFNDTQMIMGTLLNPNLVGAYLVITLPAFLHLKRLAFISAVPLVCIFFSDSLMAIACLFAGVAYLILNQYKKLLYIGAMVSMVLVFFFVKGHDSNRFMIWKQSFQAVDAQHLIIGKGPAWFADQQFKDENQIVAQEEHNEFIALFNWFGLLGIALLLKPFWNFLKSKDADLILPCSLFIAFCNAFGHFNLHQSTTAIIILIALAFCLAQGEKHVINLER